MYVHRQTFSRHQWAHERDGWHDVGGTYINHYLAKLWRRRTQNIGFGSLGSRLYRAQIPLLLELHRGPGQGDSASGRPRDP